MVRGYATSRETLIKCNGAEKRGNVLSYHLSWRQSSEMVFIRPFSQGHHGRQTYLFPRGLPTPIEAPGNRSASA
jgi:hypothetical protein